MADYPEAWQDLSAEQVAAVIKARQALADFYDDPELTVPVVEAWIEARNDAVALGVTVEHFNAGQQYDNMVDVFATEPERQRWQEREPWEQGGRER